VREADFRTWLEERRWNGEPLSPKAIYGRIRRIARLERSLVDLGYSTNDLDTVFAERKLETLRNDIKALIEGGPDGVRPPASLVPQASDPAGQLRNIYAVLRQYEQFAQGFPSGGAKVRQRLSPVAARQDRPRGHP